MIHSRSLRFAAIVCLMITIRPSQGQDQDQGFIVRDRSTGRSRVLKPSYVRTELKVARSLNHDDTETIDVKSNTGGLASIIVKKRPEGRYHTSSSYHKSTRNQNNSTDDFGRWTPLSSSSIRFAEPTNEGSRQVINSFMEHIGKVERNLQQQQRQDQQSAGSAVNIDHRRPDNLLLARQVPEPTVIRSDAVYVKDNKPAKSSKRGRSLVHIDPIDGIPIVEGVRVPDDEEDKKKTWRNARVIKGELVPYEKGYVPPRVQVSGELVFSKDQPAAPSFDRTSIGPFTKSDNFQRNEAARSFGPFTIEDNIRNEPRPAIRSSSGPFFVADNIDSNAKILEYIKKVNSEPQWYAARSSKFYDNQRLQNNQPQIQRRMLPAASESQNLNFINDIDGAESFRNPIIEYAHPELGIQPAKPVPKQAESVKFKKVQYYVNDNVNTNGKKKFTAIHTPALNSHEYYQEDPYYNSYKPTATYPYNYGFLNKVKEQPLWWKISEQVRDSFQSGMTSVGQMTRPVFEPIMEAGQKISQNLGFVKFNNQFAENKVGIVGPVSATSAILPAIGLVAGGAALGIGAMAVGKYFDGDILKRDNEGNFLDPEHKRAIEAIYAAEGQFYPMNGEIQNRPEDLVVSRQRRSLPIRNQIRYLDVEQPTIATRPDGQSDVGDLLQNIEKVMPNTLTGSFEDQIRRTDWTNTSCAKKTFCKVMLHQNSDQLVLMEKKMETLLATMHPKASSSISNHLTDVMQAINQRNCEVFYCMTQ